MARTSNLIMCSFCGKSHAEVLRLIAGPGVYICDRCITVCIDILDRELTKNAHQRLADSWRTIKQYVIGLCRTCLEWFRDHVLDKLPSLPSADTQHEEEPCANSFTFRSNTKCRVEISLGLYHCLVSNTTIIKQMAAFGFHYVNVVGAGRNRTIEATWLNDDTPITVRSLEGKIESKSEIPLAELLEGIGKAEEL